MPYYMKKKKTDITKERKSKKTNYVDKLDRIFSLYIRLRDAMPNGTIKCISCGQIKPFASFDCGHYYSRTHLGTRWDEDNCNAECSYCNRFKADHMEGYRRNLIDKIGQKRFDLLGLKAHTITKKDEFAIKLLIIEYERKVDEMKRIKNLYI